MASKNKKRWDLKTDSLKRQTNYVYRGRGSSLNTIRAFILCQDTPNHVHTSQWRKQTIKMFKNVVDNILNMWCSFLIFVFLFSSFLVVVVRLCSSFHWTLFIFLFIQQNSLTVPNKVTFAFSRWTAPFNPLLTKLIISPPR